MFLSTHSITVFTGEDPVLLSLQTAIEDELRKYEKQQVNMLNAEIQSLELMARDLNYHKETLDTHQAQMSSEIVSALNCTISNWITSNSHQFEFKHHALVL